MSEETSEKSALVPRLRFPEFRGAGDWVEMSLGEIGEIVTGKTPSTSDDSLWNGDIQFVTPTDISEEKYQWSTQRSVAINANTKVLPLHSTMFTCIASIGKMALSVKPCITNQQINTVIPNKGYENEFVYYSLLNIVPLIKGTQANSTLPIINKTEFSKFTIPVPRVHDEQQKIADCLSYLDELITAEAQKLDALKTHKKGLMQQLFPRAGETVPRLRFPEFRDAGEWEVKTLSDLADNLDNRRIPVTESERIKGGIPYYGASGIVDYIHDFIFDEDLLCISEDGANLVARTTPIAFSIAGKTWVNNHAHVLKFDLKCVQKIVEDYLNSISLEDYLTGMAQPKLNRAMLDTIPVPIPQDDGEQQAVADCLSSLDDLITAQGQMIDALKTHKKGLMQQLFPVLDEVQT